MIQIVNKQECCGCEACVQACPKQCISFNEDNEGFHYPMVDESVCVECGACERTCPVLSPYGKRKPKKQVAAINPNDAVRKESSSGGIFSMLAENVIRKGGIVFGVRFDDKWQAVFDFTDTIEGLAAFRGSKYVQARVGKAFVEAKDFLQQGREVLFSGTSCQVAALRHYLRCDYDNLLLVDIVCHGVPSPKVWGKYLDEVTRNAVTAIKDVQFRNKKQGWKRFNFDLTYDKEGQIYNISSWHQQNHFMRIFLNDVILRPSCHNCKAKGGRSWSDITIADFWGINQLNPQMDDDGGTSLILLYSDKGSEAFETLSLNTWEANYDDILRYNPSIEISKPEHLQRNLFFSRLDDTDSVVSLIDDTLRIPHTERLKQLPQRMYNLLYRLIRRLLRGGKQRKYKSPSQNIPLVLQGNTKVVAFTFRSKDNGWKQYRMEISIGTK